MCSRVRITFWFPHAPTRTRKRVRRTGPVSPFGGAASLWSEDHGFAIQRADALSASRKSARSPEGRSAARNSSARCQQAGGRVALLCPCAPSKEAVVGRPAAPGSEESVAPERSSSSSRWTTNGYPKSRLAHGRVSNARQAACCYRTPGRLLSSEEPTADKSSKRRGWQATLAKLVDVARGTAPGPVEQPANRPLQGPRIACTSRHGMAKRGPPNAPNDVRSLALPSASRAAEDARSRRTTRSARRRTGAPGQVARASQEDGRGERSARSKDSAPARSHLQPKPEGESSFGAEPTGRRTARGRAPSVDDRFR